MFAFCFVVVVVILLCVKQIHYLPFCAISLAIFMHFVYLTYWQFETNDKGIKTYHIKRYILNMLCHNFPLYDNALLLTSLYTACSILIALMC